MAKGKAFSAAVLRTAGREALGGTSISWIADNLHVSETSVRDFRERLINHKITAENLMSMSDTELLLVQYPGMDTELYKRTGEIFISKGEDPGTDFGKLAADKIRTGKTRLHYYSQYLNRCIKEHRQPLSKSSFYRQLSREIDRIAEDDEYVMIKEHPYGFSCEIDFAGRQVKIRRRGRKEPDIYSVFVIVWSASCLVHASLIRHMNTRESCNGIAAAVTAWNGAVPSVIICDNAKCWVTKHTAREEIINPSFADFIGLFGMTAAPAPVGGPTSKSAAEYSVRLISTNVIPVIEEMEDLPEDPVRLNAVFNDLIERLINQAPFLKGTTTRRGLFETLERAAATTVPVSDIPVYAEVLWQRPGADYHVVFDGNSYSAPHELKGHMLKIRAYDDTVEIWDDDRRVACHARCHEKGHVITQESHMPENHAAMKSPGRRYASREDVEREARRYGADVVELCSRCFTGCGDGRKDLSRAARILGAVKMNLRHQTALRKAIREMLDSGFLPKVSVLMGLIRKNLARQQPGVPESRNPCDITYDVSGTRGPETADEIPAADDSEHEEEWESDDWLSNPAILGE